MFTEWLYLQDLSKTLMKSADTFIYWINKFTALKQLVSLSGMFQHFRSCPINIPEDHRKLTCGSFSF